MHMRISEETDAVACGIKGIARNNSTTVPELVTCGRCLRANGTVRKPIAIPTPVSVMPSAGAKMPSPEAPATPAVPTPPKIHPGSPRATESQRATREQRIQTIKDRHQAVREKLAGKGSKVHEPKPHPLCKCGCGERTKGGTFKPGHDARYYASLHRGEKASRKKMNPVVIGRSGNPLSNLHADK